MALHLPSSTNVPGFEAWPDCWVSAEFLRAPIPRKGSGSTTTTATSVVVCILVVLYSRPYSLFIFQSKPTIKHELKQTHQF